MFNFICFIILIKETIIYHFTFVKRRPGPIWQTVTVMYCKVCYTFAFIQVCISKIYALSSHYRAMQLALFLVTWLQDLILRFIKRVQVVGTKSLWGRSPRCPAAALPCNPLGYFCLLDPRLGP